MDFSENVFPPEAIIVIAVLLINFIVSFLILRFIKRRRRYSGKPSKREIVYGYIESIGETGWSILNDLNCYSRQAETWRLFFRAIGV